MPWKATSVTATRWRKTPPADFDSECVRKVEQEIVEHGGGDVPQLGADAASVGPAVSYRAQYRITAIGADTASCMDVKRTHDGYIETVAPGLSGDAAAVKLPKYTFTVSSPARRFLRQPPKTAAKLSVTRPERRQGPQNRSSEDGSRISPLSAPTP